MTEHHTPVSYTHLDVYKRQYPDTTFEDLCIPFNFPTLRTKAKFCAIPSTSGTATEVTAFSVITDYAKGIKYPLADFNITPDVAIVDSALAEKMPAKLTAHTGMDAMTHAIEAYVSTLHCDYTDPLALHAIKLIFENLEVSYGGDAAAREMCIRDRLTLYVSLTKMNPSRRFTLNSSVNRAATKLTKFCIQHM